MKRLVTQLPLLGLMLLGVSSFAQEGGIVNEVSPKLRQFLQVHSSTLQLLTNTVSEAFAGRSVQVYYFYSDDESAARTYHYYPSESVVGICIRENQHPLDEFISLVFESLNSEGEKQFEELYRRAESRDISRTDFAHEMLKQEFIAVKRTRNLLRNLKFSAEESSDSFYWKRFSECPDNFEDFISYTARTSSHGDPVKEFEAKYDSLQKP